jgi:hypothetical protein
MIFLRFPQDLAQYKAGGVPTGKILGELPGFGRLHGVLPDPQNMYVTANFLSLEVDTSALSTSRRRKPYPGT